MIKNILYSLFLHSLLALLIYINFRNIITEDVQNLTNGITVSMASLDNKKSDISPGKSSTAQKEPQEQIKKTPEIKKPIVKQKKVAKPKSNPKPIVEKHNEFKQKDEPKEEVVMVAKEDEVPAEEQLTEESPQESANSNINDLENINLSAREKFNIHSQLKSCYSRTIIDGADDFNITVKVNVLQDGTIEFNLETTADMARYNDPKETKYRQTIDKIISTLEFCSPLRNLPIEKYDIWKEFTINFGNARQ